MWAELATLFRSMGADQRKIDELEAEFRAHSALVDRLALLLPGTNLACSQEAGRKLAEYNGTLRNWMAPRTNAEIRSWATELFDRLCEQCSLPTDAVLSLSAFESEARQFWQASPWYGKNPAPIPHRAKAPEENEQLEAEAIEWFLRKYNAQAVRKLNLEGMGDKPDALLRYEDDASPLGMEIVHLYYDDEDARLVLGRAKKFTSHMQGLTQLVDRLNNEINEKARKVPNFDVEYPVSLLIRCASRIFTVDDYRAPIKRGKVIVPPGIFHEVWLLAQDSNLPGWPHLINLA